MVKQQTGVGATLGARCGQLLRLALKDLRRDWALAVCEVFAIAAVLAPLLILAGLQQGVLARMLNDLAQNVAMREITPRVTGTNRFDQAWLDSAGARPDISFVIGDVLSLAASVELANPSDDTRPPINALLTPTAKGDPLTSALPPALATLADRATVIISSGVATALGLKAGDTLDLTVPRTNNGTDESRLLTARVSAILPAETADRPRRLVLVDPALLLDVRDYRNGFAVPDLGWAGAPPPARHSPFERFRLYAQSIDAVEGVVDWLRATGVEPVSALDQIAPLRSLNASLTTILRIIGAFAALGFVVSLGATRWSSVQRKHRELALLTLVGYGPGWLVGLPLVQASLVAVLGTLLAGTFYGAAAILINATFPGVTNACALTAGQLGAAAGLTWCLAVLAATAAAVTAFRIDPAAAIRDS